MSCIVVLFNRALRLRDHPALATAARRADTVVPLFVVDPAVVAGFGAPNRLAFLRETLADLQVQLRELGTELVLRHGPVPREAVDVARAAQAEAIFFTGDVTGYASGRERELEGAATAAGLAVVRHPGVSGHDPGVVTPSGGGDHFKVFTPYFRAWSARARRPVAARPKTLPGPIRAVPGAELDVVLPARVDRRRITRATARR